MLPRAARLRKEREFRAVFSRSQARSRSFSSTLLSVHLRGRGPVAGTTSPPLLRFGFTVAKKVSKRAHDRNLIKRRLREIVRRDVVPFYTGPAMFDCVVVARIESLGAEFGAMRFDLLSMLKRCGLNLDQAAVQAAKDS